MKVFELKKRKSLSHAIHAIALVEKPAIETDFIYLSVEGKKAETNIFLSEEKGLIYSPVLIPNQRIDRVNENTGEPYQIFFSKETIEEAAYDLMKAKTPLSSFNEEHSDKVIDATNVVELWLVDGKNDKSTSLGFNVPEGTLMAGIKVDDPETREKIKLGKIKGISIEGLFQDFELVEEDGKQINLNKQVMNKIETYLEKSNTLLSKLLGEKPEGKVKLGMVQVDENTVLYFEGDSVEEGDRVFTDAEMTTPASGEFVVDGVRHVIVEGVAVTVESVEEEEMKKKEEMAEVQMKQIEATVKLSESHEALKKENAELTEKLTKLSEQVAKHAELLKRVEESESKGKVELAAQPVIESKANEYLNNRKYY